MNKQLIGAFIDYLIAETKNNKIEWQTLSDLENEENEEFLLVKQLESLISSYNDDKIEISKYSSFIAECFNSKIILAQPKKNGLDTFYNVFETKELYLLIKLNGKFKYCNLLLNRNHINKLYDLLEAAKEVTPGQAYAIEIGQEEELETFIFDVLKDNSRYPDSEIQQKPNC